jgi:hypothetical protein
MSAKCKVGVETPEKSEIQRLSSTSDDVRLQKKEGFH